MDGLRYSRDCATGEDIADHLRICSDQFAPTLESRVNIEEYSEKIRNFANTFEAWFEQKLVGLVAAYQNTKSNQAFVTSVSTTPRYAGNGIGFILMAEMIEFYRSSSIFIIELEVNSRADQAISLYRKSGFQNSQPDIDGTMRMTLMIETL
jgi:ribosomal protein S18 acetylase RimI-like enzyme